MGNVLGQYNANERQIVKLVNELVKHTKLITNTTSDNICRRTFIQCVFSSNSQLGNGIFNYLSGTRDNTLENVSKATFLSHLKKLMREKNKETLFFIYLDVFSHSTDNLLPVNYKNLLFTALNIAMEEHPHGPQVCPEANEIIMRIVNGAFRDRPNLNFRAVHYSTHYYCHRVIHIIHNYTTKTFQSATEKVSRKDFRGFTEGYVIVRPTVPRLNPTSNSTDSNLIPKSLLWILGATLSGEYHLDVQHNMSSLIVINMRPKLYSFPTHWILLYNSLTNGSNSNDFMHCLFGYKAPTLLFVGNKQDLQFCVSRTEIWEESSQYHVSYKGCLIQVCPLYRVVTSNPKIYMNFNSEGEDHCIKVTHDPRNPLLVIDGAFQELRYRGAVSTIHHIKVWGCGPPEAREEQERIRIRRQRRLEKGRLKFRSRTLI